MTDFEIAGNHFKLVCYSEIISAPEINQFLKDHHPAICLVDAQTIISVRQIKIAVMNALALQKSNQMQCKTIYLEILRCLSPDGRLSSAFKNLAITDKTTQAFGIMLDESSEIPQIPGLGPILDFQSFFDSYKPNFTLINKLYMITEDMLSVYSYEDIICSTLSIVASDLVRTHGS